MPACGPPAACRPRTTRGRSPAAATRHRGLRIGAEAAEARKRAGALVLVHEDGPAPAPRRFRAARSPSSAILRSSGMPTLSENPTTR